MWISRRFTVEQEASEKREPELLGSVLADVLLDIFRRRLEIAEREIEREDVENRGSHQ
jgi:hypothetical protein